MTARRYKAVPDKSVALHVPVQERNDCRPFYECVVLSILHQVFESVPSAAESFAQKRGIIHGKGFLRNKKSDKPISSGSENLR